MGVGSTEAHRKERRRETGQAERPVLKEELANWMRHGLPRRNRPATPKPPTRQWKVRRVGAHISRAISSIIVDSDEAKRAPPVSHSPHLYRFPSHSLPHTITHHTPYLVASDHVHTPHSLLYVHSLHRHFPSHSFSTCNLLLHFLFGHFLLFPLTSTCNTCFLP